MIEAPIRKGLLVGLAGLLLIAWWSWIQFAHAPFGARFAEETYEAALRADDAGDTERARGLLVEACGEGSNPACEAVGMRR
jgi:hypothetical protein